MGPFFCKQIEVRVNCANGAQHHCVHTVACFAIYCIVANEYSLHILSPNWFYNSRAVVALPECGGIVGETSEKRLF